MPELVLRLDFELFRVASRFPSEINNNKHFPPVRMTVSAFNNADLN
jgi:hypothetical protein